MVCVLVLGVARSGTSCVAGVLHHLGVFMGERFLPANKINPKGFFHDLEFELAFHEGRPAVASLVRQKNELHSLWGCNTRHTNNLDLFNSDLKVVHVRRNFDSVCKSWEHITGSVSSEAVARKTLEVNQAIERLISVPRLDLTYEQMCKSPVDYVTQIAHFISQPATHCAIDFVDPTLRHF